MTKLNSYEIEITELRRELAIANERIARESKRANDQWAAAQMERESAEYWKAKAEALQSGPNEMLVALKKARCWMIENPPMDTSAAMKYYEADLEIIDAAIRSATHESSK